MDLFFEDIGFFPIDARVKVMHCQAIDFDNDGNLKPNIEEIWLSCKVWTDGYDVYVKTFANQIYGIEKDEIRVYCKDNMPQLKRDILC